MRLADAEMERRQQDALELSQRISETIDRELVGLAAALEALATSPALEAGDMVALERQARSVLERRGFAIVLRDRNGQQLLNTARPTGIRLPLSRDATLREADRLVMETGGVQVSDLFFGTMTQRPLVQVGAPVATRGGNANRGVEGVLSMGLEAADLARMLERMAPAGWTVALVDRNDRVVARSHDHDRSVGLQATADLRRETRGVDGTWIGTTLEGTPVLGAYTRSTVSGWRVAVGVPIALVREPYRRLIFGLAAGAVASFALSALLATLFAGSIVRPLTSLKRAAAELGRGDRIMLPATGLREADEIGAALVSADEEIGSRREALEASRKRFAAAVEAVSGVLWTNDAQGRMVGPQPGWQALTGQAEREYQGYGWSEALHPEDAAATVSAWKRAVDAQSVFATEHRVRMRDGSYRRFAVRAVPVRIDGTTREWVGVHTDITEEHEAKVLLARSEARMRAVFSAAPIGIIFAEAPSGRIVAGNAQAEAILGHPILTSPSSADYARWSALDADGRPLSAEDYPLARVIREEADEAEAEMLYRRGDARVVWVRAIAGAIRENGRLVGGVVAILDIDQRKRAEAELRALNADLSGKVAEAIAERERIWRISTELMPVAGFDGTIAAVNPAWATTLGWSDVELLGTSFFDLIHPDDFDATRAEAERLAHGLTTLHFENRYRHKDGTYRVLSWTAVPEAEQIHAIARDVTAERDAEAALRRTEAQLHQAQKMEVVGQLTGGVAHDFNNLLQVMIGSLGLAQRRIDEPEASERVRRSIALSLEAAQRATTLVHRLLAFSRRAPLRPAVLRVDETVRGMADLIARSLGERIVLETSLAQDTWWIEADPNQVESALLNLCVNARDAMPGGGRLAIEVANATLDESSDAVLRREAEAGRFVVIAVSDTGIGMPAEVRERAFEPFFTTKPVGRGSGLGLSQVLGFVQQSGGHVSNRSEPGQGTRVELYFPRTDRVPAAETATHVLPGEVQGRGETVLLVEDDDAVRELTVSILREEGYEVIEATNGLDALANLRRAPGIALLLSDIVLPGELNGREVAEEAVRVRPSLKVLLTTGYARDAFDKPLSGEFSFDIIKKPFSPGDLARRVRRILDRS